MKKVLLMAAVLASISFSIADASQFVMTQRAIVKGAYREPDSADFKEGKKTIRFMSMEGASGHVYTLTAMSKPDWLLRFDTYWTYTVKAEKRELVPDYIIEQFKDVDTGRYFYGIHDIRFGEDTWRAFLLGMDDNKKSMITYMDSNNFDKPEDSRPGFYVRNKTLFFAIGGLGNDAYQPGYELNWSDEAKWFGYDYYQKLGNSPKW